MPGWPAKDTCSNCLLFDLQFSECRAATPKGPVRGFPTVRQDDWCSIHTSPPIDERESQP
jgi:hypothetical protein